ncbi:hypothetical protein PAXRUDRAFT_831002 [Paxillus rubicundulus Ve08.2h10]|uniref:Uncharacterized protein n=1 Tax=Paxillus rubicundulus Ve08.2h10 TaxID=930991 RepID=A0A0D0DXR5_9AGAM|nr:hypothetical protein PAXRUDRAFT_831002 [Paxillus rubicundulus Ve08.2h10]
MAPTWGIRLKQGSFPYVQKTNVAAETLDSMPSSPVPFIATSGLVTFQHDLKARISSSPLLKMPLTMRPFMKKRLSMPFSLKRRSTTTISSHSSSSSVLSSNSHPATSSAATVSDVVDPVTMTHMATVSPRQTPVGITPNIGAKILDRFWPEEENLSKESYPKAGCSRQFMALSPPPHHRRVAHAFTPPHGIPFSDEFPSRSSPEHNPGPLRFPF